MSTQKKFAVDEKIAQKNLVLSLKQKGDWKKIKLLGEQGNTFAQKACADHEWALAHPRVVKKTVVPVVLTGPAVAGKHGGGKEAPALPQTESKKTNVPNQGPKKGASGSATTPNSGRQKKDDKKKNKGNKKDKK